MKRVFLILIAVFLLTLKATTTHAATTVNVNNNHNNYGAGDAIVTSIALANSGDPVTVDVYLALVLPDQTVVFFQYDNGLVPQAATGDPSTWAKLVSNVTLPGGFETGSVPIFMYTASGAEQPGIYQWVFAVVPAGTLDVLDFKTASFFLSPRPVDTFLGVWNVTTSLPSLGGSGTATLEVLDSAPGILSLSANGYSAGVTSSFNATGVLTLQGGISLTMTGDVFGTLVQGSGFVDPSGNISGTINVTSVGPFIQAITNISGTISGGVLNTTEVLHYTDGTSGLEYLTAIHQ